MPSIFAGVQNALSMAWMCVLAAEMVGARQGVGFIIIQGMDLNKPAMYTVAYALKMFNDSSQADYGATFAMSALSLVPVLTLFFFFQKNLVEGISIQGLKG